MSLIELLSVINDSTVVQLYSAETYDKIPDGFYDGKDSIDERYEYCEVTDVFVDDGVLCIEIDVDGMEEE